MTPSDHMSEKYIILTEKYQQQLTQKSLCPARSLPHLSLCR